MQLNFSWKDAHLGLVHPLRNRKMKLVVMRDLSCCKTQVVQSEVWNFKLEVLVAENSNNSNVIIINNQSFDSFVVHYAANVYLGYCVVVKVCR